MATEKLLFVGGREHGKYHYVDAGCNSVETLPTLSPRDVVVPRRMYGKAGQFAVERSTLYRRYRLRIRDTLVEFFVVATVDTDPYVKYLDALRIAEQAK